MKQYFRRTASVASLGLVVALFSACGGGGSDGVKTTSTTTTIAGTTTTTIAGVTTTTVAGSTTTTTVGGTTTTTLPGTPGVYSGKTEQAPLATVISGATGSSDYLPICSAASLAPKLVVDDAVGQLLQVAGAKQVAKSTYLSPPGIPTTSYNPYSTPQAGSCGGTVEIPASSFSHSAGTTRGTFVYKNYCEYDSGTSGPKEIIDGSVAFVSNGTSSPNGPIISSYDATIPKLTVTGQDASGTISSKAVVSGGFKLNPDKTINTVNMTEVVVTEGIKTTKITGLNVTMTQTATSTTESITARLYISSAGYVDISTKTPISIDASGKYTAGIITLKGTEGSVDFTIDTTAANGPVFTNSTYKAKLDCSSAL